MKITTKNHHNLWVDINISVENAQINYSAGCHERNGLAAAFFEAAYDLAEFDNHDNPLIKLLTESTNDKIIEVLEHRAEIEDNEDMLNSLEHLRKFI